MNHVSMRASGLRSGLGVLAVASVLLAGCSSSSDATAGQTNSAPTTAPAATSATPAATPAAAPAVSKGFEHGIGDVPWSQVGPGWMLTVWSPVTPRHPGEEPVPGEPTRETATTVLYLVDPAGDRYTITEFLPDQGSPDLVDWSGDGSHALFTTTKDGEAQAISIDLHTGTRTAVPVDGTPKYTRPAGKALLVSTRFNGAEPGTLKRIDLAGDQQLA